MIDDPAQVIDLMGKIEAQLPIPAPFSRCGRRRGSIGGFVVVMLKFAAKPLASGAGCTLQVVRPQTRGVWRRTRGVR